VTSRMTNGAQASSSSDTGSIVTFLHRPRDVDFVPGIRYNYAFEPDLKRSRPYQTIDLKATTSTMSLTETNIRGWSVLSGYSLADVCDISVLSLNISVSGLHSPNHYAISSEYFGRSKSHESESLKLQVLRGELKASKLKNTWSLATANLRASLYKKQGRIASAENMHRRVLEMNVKVMGQEHKSTLDAVFGLGLLYDEQDKLAEAELMYQRALTGREKTLRLEHESTLTPHTNLPVFTPNKIKWSKPK
jgi:hypothetical protein